MREGAHAGPRQPHALNDGPMVQGVAQHEDALAAGLEQARQHGRVRGEAHAEDERVLLLQELGDLALQLPVDRQGATLRARAGAREAVLQRGLPRRRGAERVNATEPQVVVGGHVDALLGLVRAFELVERPKNESAGADADNHVHGGVGGRRYRAVEAVDIELVHVLLVEFHPTAVPPLAHDVAARDRVPQDGRVGTHDVLPDHAHHEEAEVAPVGMELRQKGHLDLLVREAGRHAGLLRGVLRGSHAEGAPGRPRKARRRGEKRASGSSETAEAKRQ
mmetsp:Transcript_50321/g.133062  ORF Transcript_50321/g.133062 Transcript_50321/m.133062 type:complete len:278 (+) Transcript_50321:2351-3184(+)